jgi:hypothetical protein
MRYIRIEDKIPAFKGKAVKSNTAIFLALALYGPKNRYELQKITEISYSVIHRRIHDLLKLGYLDIVSRRVLAKNPNQSAPIYHLSWKGLIACLAFPNVTVDIVNVLRRSPSFKIPSKEESLKLIENYFDNKVIHEICTDFFEHIIQVLPYNIELISIQDLILYLIPTLRSMNLLKLGKSTLDDSQLNEFIRTTEWMKLLEDLYDLMDENIKISIQARDELGVEIDKIKNFK